MLVQQEEGTRRLLLLSNIVNYRCMSCLTTVSSCKQGRFRLRCYEAKYCPAACCIYQILSKSSRSSGCKEFHRYLTPPPWRHSRWSRDKKWELHSRVRDEAAAAHSSSTAAASPRAEGRSPALLLQGLLLSGPRVG